MPRAANVIYKYTLTQMVNIVDMPETATPLSIQNQNNIPVIWAISEKGASTTLRSFTLYGTGEEFFLGPEDQYIGTVQCGPYVWHIFENL